jgi:NADH-quinone oxidoreductase subunit L
VGDFGFLLGIAAILYFLGTLDYATAFGAAPSLSARRCRSRPTRTGMPRR